MKRYSILFLICCLISFSLFAQEQKETQNGTDTTKTVFDQKFYWGFSFNNHFSGITGSDLPETYFIKPSIGGGFMVEYYFSKNLGIETGLSYQQHGAGIKTPDVVKELGNPDSTNRMRLRFHALEVPLMLHFRTPKAFIAGTRLNLSLGVVPMSIFKTGQIFHSVEDGFHTLTNVSKDYMKADVALRAGLGLDMNAAEACIFRVNLVGSYGTSNIYKNKTTFSDAKGKAYSLGIRLQCLF